MSAAASASWRRLAVPLRRVYGQAWDAAPPALSGAVAAIVVSNLVAFALTVVSLVVAAEPPAVAAAVLALLAVVVLVDVALAALLLRGSRLVWLAFVALHASALALTPEDSWEVPGYVTTVVVLVLLLAPSTVCTVWRSRPSPYAPTYDDVRRRD